jgi:hypothetical protein
MSPFPLSLALMNSKRREVWTLYLTCIGTLYTSNSMYICPSVRIPLNALVNKMFPERFRFPREFSLFYNDFWVKIGTDWTRLNFFTSMCVGKLGRLYSYRLYKYISADSLMSSIVCSSTVSRHNVSLYHVPHLHMSLHHGPPFVPQCDIT